MNQQQTDFHRLWNQLGSSGVMTLATCANNRVTARAMSVVILDGKFLCQTDTSYLKYRQIALNPNVCLCVSHFTIEGTCRSLGKPADNPQFIQQMQACFPSAVARWSSLPAECVLEITPRLVSSWIYEDDKPYIERWDFTTGTYTKELQAGGVLD